ncbi:MAG: histidine triad nucleotide-binding protein [Bacillota bacterium]|jgi:histidine triad (HIT) family protein
MSDCLFCKMIAREINTHVVYEDDDVLAFHDIAPKAPVHILIIPKKHIASLAEMTASDTLLMGKILYVATQLAEKHGIDKSGYRLVTNCREDGGQEVFHLHFHLIGGKKLAGFA